MLILFPLLLAGSLRAEAYLWPSPKLDALESARFDQDGFNSGLLPAFVIPCTNSLAGGPEDQSGRSNAADWIRTAYHDMATHNATDGTGGLDASIRFAAEQARPENVGDGFSNTFIPILGFFATNRYVGLADALAIAAVLAIENCGGPEIAFRGGRVDASVPDAPGVPEPQQDLDSHIASFARQGFTSTEMIALVACGHTFGGVQHSAFPNIVNDFNTTDDSEGVLHFDTTPITFDNNVATEYISGTTQNPLVVGCNDTTNSDKRIFGSDGNATMRSFAASPALFSSTCANLFARMIDTVPAGVQLTDVIAALPVKPANVELVLAGDRIQLFGQVRLWNQTESSAGTVLMRWDDRLGNTTSTSLGFAGAGAAMGGKLTSAWYGFNATDSTGFISLDAAAGIERLSFVVNGRVEDQSGVGFSVQDVYMFSATSCLLSSSSTSSSESFTGRLDVAVRAGANLTRLYIETLSQDDVNRVIVTETDIPSPVQPQVVEGSGYEMWSLNITGGEQMVFNIGAEIGGQRFSTTQLRGVAQFPACT
ncbi:heme peroxidase [Roridomyces roridus]|uniref:Peroxidase n=1 Tax=Roridomyces roridus TaxID=1738132 RepID=A0AAD7C150_9AGAR|nr:heme peroxidase [Roridomyces roridus]